MIRDGVLVEVGPTRRVENLLPARHAIEVSADGRVVMPGFVDSHTHLLFPVAGAFSGHSDTALHALHTTTAMQLKMRVSASLEAMLRHGTTTVEVKTGSGWNVGTELKMLRVLAELKTAPLDVVPTFLFRAPRMGDNSDEPSRYIWQQICSDFLPSIKRRGLIEFADLLWDDFTDTLWAGCTGWTAWINSYLQVARSLGLACKLHVDSGGIPAALRAAAHHHVLSIDHLERATAEDVAHLRESDTIATVLPAASFYSDHSCAPARAITDAGAAIALATNFNAHQTPSLSMQTVIALACQHMWLTPAEAITGATINGAHAVGRGAVVGSLECGKFADVLFLNTPDYRDLAHSLGTNLVHLVMKRGQIVYEEGKVEPRALEDHQPLW